jgi:23S rRNA (guanine2445-N2)-methyltransferase / 23S rRNA (guanine2069-N7)-methyltransferase
MRFLATCPLGVADLLLAEVKTLGAIDAREIKAGVEFNGELDLAYRVCLWSRTASRVLMPIATTDATTAQDLYDGVRLIDWSTHLASNGTLAVDFSGTSTGITHTRFGALKIKDAIVDQLRENSGERPSVDTDEPDVRINAHVHRNQATLAIDLSGESLHRRGYRDRGVAAPLKENLAAALLLRAGWPAMAEQGASFIDPMCGSGTIVIEAAMIARDIAPGLQREHYGFTKWRGHQREVWEELRNEAKERSQATENRESWIRGYDRDAHAINAALVNLRNAGLMHVAHLEKRDLSDLSREGGDVGMILTNPPYGERIGDQESLRGLYQMLGTKLREQFAGWKAAVLTGNPPLARELGIEAKRVHTIYNGALECRFLRFEIEERSFHVNRASHDDAERLQNARQRPGAQMFANRLRKNLKLVQSWARKNDVVCYRVYDADMPEYAFAIDVYQNDGTWAYVQEYAPPATIPRDAARARRLEALSAIPEVLQIDASRIHERTRRRQEGNEQYEKLDSQREFHAVREGRYRFLVNFTDYLDTGLFLDHRITRERIGQLAGGKRFLNLFAYTGTATVHAVGGGAISSTTLDMSNTYIDWAIRNLELNGLVGSQHRFVQADCLQWLDAEVQAANVEYDLMFIDPPTFSRSKRMTEEFDVQRDHVKLLLQAERLLAAGGVIVFSNNYSRFRIDAAALSLFDIEDISRATIPRDFARNATIHHCYVLHKKGAERPAA